MMRRGTLAMPFGLVARVDRRIKAARDSELLYAVGRFLPAIQQRVYSTPPVLLPYDEENEGEHYGVSVARLIQ